MDTLRKALADDLGAARAEDPLPVRVLVALLVALLVVGAAGALILL